LNSAAFFWPGGFAPGLFIALIFVSMDGGNAQQSPAIALASPEAVGS